MRHDLPPCVTHHFRGGSLHAPTPVKVLICCGSWTYGIVCFHGYATE
jgi:hypothetical protein